MSQANENPTSTPSPTATPAATPRPNDMNLVWLDMEMTGLDPDTDRIIEVAVVVTDAELKRWTRWMPGTRAPTASRA
jgi:oligoribonuclease